MKGKGNLSFQSVKRPHGANRCIFWLWKKLWKQSGFVICSYFKDSTSTAVKRDAKFWTRYLKGVPLRRPMKGVPFLSKMMYKSPHPPTRSLVIHSLNLSASGAGILMISCHQTNCCVACQSRETLYQVNSQVKSMIIKISSLDENSTHFFIILFAVEVGCTVWLPISMYRKSSIKPPGGAYFFQALLRGGLIERGGLI